MLVVTGASGLLGANLLLRARDSGLSVAGVAGSRRMSIPGITVHCADLTDASACRSLMAQLKPSAVIHCAAATNLDWCEDHAVEAHAINTEVPALLAELSRGMGANFLHISTDAVFDGTQGNYKETDRPGPLSVYAKTKLRAEQGVLRRDPSAIVARVNIYGWNAQPKRSLAEWIFQELETGKQVPGFVDVYFTPMLVNHLAGILLEMLDADCAGLYHVAGSERISKFEFARRVASEFGFDPEQVFPAQAAEANLRARRSPDISMNTAKIQAALGQPMPDVNSGLRRFRALREAGYPQQLKSYLAGARE